MTQTKDNRIRRLYTLDNLPVLRSIDSETVDLIYLDPPFNSGKKWENPIGEGNKRALASFKDTWELSDTHADEEYALSLAYPETIPLIDALYEINGGSWKAYLIYMGARIAEMRRILKSTGSIYYHCDPVMSHGVKLLMDAIFGGGYGKNQKFRNEISWERTRTSKVASRYGYNHDVILFYSKTRQGIWNSPRTTVDSDSKPPSSYKKDKDGRYYRTIDVVALPGHGGDKPMYTYKGFTPKTRWLMTLDKLEALDEQGMLVFSKTGRPYRKQYWDAHPGIPVSDIWTDIAGGGQMPKKERTDYPTQKPLALLERIIKASSREDDLVLDPFCGCATTCLAAEYLKRQWIGIDLAEDAATLVHDRLQKEGEGLENVTGYKVEHLRSLPKRTDLDGLRSDNAILKPRLYKMQNKKCLGCDKETRIELMDFDHIIAKIRGGQDIDENIQLHCRDCNTTKGDRGMHYLWRRILERRTEEKMREYETKRRKRAGR